MAETYFAGYAFIVEGDTEKEFYLSLLEFFCRKHSAKMERIVNEATPDVIYVITFSNKQLLVKFHAVNAISQVPRAGKWFTSQCAKKHAKNYLGMFSFVMIPTSTLMTSANFTKAIGMF